MTCSALTSALPHARSEVARVEHDRARAPAEVREHGGQAQTDRTGRGQRDLVADGHVELARERSRNGDPAVPAQPLRRAAPGRPRRPGLRGAASGLARGGATTQVRRSPTSRNTPAVASDLRDPGDARQRLDARPRHGERHGRQLGRGVSRCDPQVGAVALNARASRSSPRCRSKCEPSIATLPKTASAPVAASAIERVVAVRSSPTETTSTALRVRRLSRSISRSDRGEQTGDQQQHAADEQPRTRRAWRAARSRAVRRRPRRARRRRSSATRRGTNASSAWLVVLAVDVVERAAREEVAQRAQRGERRRRNPAERTRARRSAAGRSAGRRRGTRTTGIRARHGRPRARARRRAADRRRMRRRRARARRTARASRRPRRRGPRGAGRR